MNSIPNILIVDDSNTGLAYLEIVLKGVEANLIKAGSGSEALEISRGKDLSLAILDVRMAVMNGYELAVKINQERTDQKVPIIFLTAAYSDHEKILEGYDAGAVDYIVKPLHKRILVSKVNVFWNFIGKKNGSLKKSEELKASQLEVIKAKEQLERLNEYLIEAREQERTEISMMVHDELGQAMTALKMDLNWLRENIQNHADSVEKINRMIGVTNDIIKRVQHLSAELHPGILEDLGLASAIEWYCEEFQQRTDIACNLSLEDIAAGNSYKNISLFRILQEALTNVIRHAKAGRVDIRLFHSGEGVGLIIEDNGVGISQEKSESGKSFGLIGMRARVHQCGGVIEFSSPESGGTRIVTFIP